jgi:hypothetical protein
MATLIVFSVIRVNLYRHLWRNLWLKMAVKLLVRSQLNIAAMRRFL